jgi:hypothetical protein
MSIFFEIHLADVDGFIEKFVLLRKIEVGEQQIAAGLGVSHDDAKERLGQWLGSSGGDTIRNRLVFSPDGRLLACSFPRARCGYLDRQRREIRKLLVATHAQVGIENMNLICGLERTARLSRRGLHPNWKFVAL